MRSLTRSFDARITDTAARTRSRFPLPLSLSAAPAERCIEAVAKRGGSQLNVAQSGRATATDKPESGELRAGADPGSWNFSPEWMGTQGGGWGHNAGEVVFSEQSRHGNGRVWVTRHYASKRDGIPISASTADPGEAIQLRQEEAAGEDARASDFFQEWRVLRFNEDTRQSVARVEVSLEGDCDLHIRQRPDCMAFLYMKTLGATVAALVGLAPRGSSLASAGRASSARSDGDVQRCRALCVGLGGGSLPLFLAHHFPGIELDVVEIDPVVIAAARDVMGFPRTRERLRVHEGDAVAWLREHQASGCPHFDLAFVDAFDGDNQVPTPFTDAGGPFLEVLAQALHPGHGAVLLNVHRGEAAPLWTQVLLKIAGRQWLDPFVTPIAQVYRRICLPLGNGCAYMLGVGRQYNTVVVVARGTHLGGAQELPEKLRESAATVAKRANFRFQAAEKAVLEFTLVPEE